MDSFRAREMLATNVRFRQLRQLSKAPDRIPQASAPGNARPCGLDGRRIADDGPKIPIGGQDRALSESVRTRLTWGRRLRSGMYQALFERDLSSADDRQRLAAITKRLRGVRFSQDLEQLAHCDAFRALNNKIAVIYLDGNRFGALQRGHATTPETQRGFDRELRRRRARLLLDL